MIVARGCVKAEQTFREKICQHQQETPGIYYRMTGYREMRVDTNASSEWPDNLATRVGARGGRREPDTVKGRILRRRIRDERK